jgi:hypothetical protein
MTGGGGSVAMIVTPIAQSLGAVAWLSLLLLIG